MSPVTLQVVQDSPSGYLMSSGVLDLFWSSLKPRGDSGNPRGSDPSASAWCQSTSNSSTYQQATTSSMSQSSSSSENQTITSSAPTATITSIASSTATESRSSTNIISLSSTSSLSSSNSSAIPAEGSTNSNSASSHKNTGAIIGAIVGGVVLLSIAALILFIFLRRRRRMKHTAPSAEFLHPNSPFQRLNTARSGSPTRTRSVFDMLPSPNNGDAGGKSLLRSLSRRDYKAPPTLEKVTVDTTSAVHAL
ncbi:hypothetical protein ARMSODRAFT_2958 [Armillaria solidipes]|uniref:Mid2 domain-containing protein n=1 Tax=Armillaria solidipes TaxID=1076256 RepID=A0A2H3C3N7_9AGAR|nr:hypothetical protein ARMSODRAFT_2958 [Armillaria solidipes]